jgi:hypothetical protein
MLRKAGTLGAVRGWRTSQHRPPCGAGLETEGSFTKENLDFYSFAFVSSF